MILKIDLDILTSLTDPLTVVRVPCAALIDYVALCCKIQDLTLSGDTCTKHDIKFCLLEWRCNLVLDYLDLGMVADHLTALLESLSPSDIHTDRCIELKGTSTCGGLRITKHNADFLTKLVDKDDHAVGSADRCSKLPECL